MRITGAAGMGLGNEITLADGTHYVCRLDVFPINAAGDCDQPTELLINTLIIVAMMNLPGREHRQIKVEVKVDDIDVYHVAVTDHIRRYCWSSVGFKYAGGANKIAAENIKSYNKDTQKRIIAEHKKAIEDAELPGQTHEAYQQLCNVAVPKFEDGRRAAARKVSAALLAANKQIIAERDELRRTIDELREMLKKS